MNKIFFLLFFPIISFSQINLCDRSVELSNEFYKNNYNNFVSGLNNLKLEVGNNDKHLNKIIDFNIARGFYFQKEYLKTKVILTQILELQDGDINGYFDCDKSVYEDDNEVENVFGGLNSYWLKVKAHRLLSDSNYYLGNYSEALINLDDFLKVKSLKKPYYSCGNALESDVIQFEHRKFDILNKLEKFDESNKSAFLILFLTEYEDLLSQLKSNLLQKHSIKEIRNEFKSSLDKVEKGFVEVAGIKLDITYISIFNYKTILWNYKEDKDYMKRIKKSKGYKTLTN